MIEIADQVRDVLNADGKSDELRSNSRGPPQRLWNRHGNRIVQGWPTRLSTPPSNSASAKYRVRSRTLQSLQGCSRRKKKPCRRHCSSVAPRDCAADGSEGLGTVRGRPSDGIPENGSFERVRSVSLHAQGQRLRPRSARKLLDGSSTPPVALSENAAGLLARGYRRRLRRRQ